MSVYVSISSFNSRGNPSIIILWVDEVSPLKPRGKAVTGSGQVGADVYVEEPQRLLFILLPEWCGVDPRVFAGVKLAVLRAGVVSGAELTH